MTPSKGRGGIEKPIVVLVLAVVSIVIAISIAFWMGGVASVLTKREQVEIPSAFAAKTGDGGWTIMVKLKNTGSMDSTIDLILINGKGLSEFGSGAVVCTPTLPFVVQAGSEITGTITVRGGTTGFMSTATVDLIFYSVSGRGYPKPVLLP